ncbi:protein ALP1-like [Rutidosis leptorrhynchoides]|uniref:protein ALP1-like n=1 Tax=Rutidosis leptorrhynchoides TaxID=125765 RepID=UPI003A99BEC7
MGSSRSPLSPIQPSDWWHHFSQRFHGTLKESPESQTFESMFKMSMKTFDYICSLVEEEMTTKCSSFVDLNGNPLSLHDMVAVVLTRLGSGEPLKLVGSSLGLNQTTVAQLTKRFVDTLISKGLAHIQWPSTEPEMEDIKCKFEKIGGLPNCCGAIDTTHILMSLQSVDRSTNFWCDRENNQSMTLQAIVDPDLRFLDVFGGCPGRMTDEQIHKSSAFNKKCKGNERLNGQKNDIQEYIVGNSGFPLLKWLITPYRGDSLSNAESVFNEIVVKTHMVANEAFVKLKQNWKILKGVLWRPDKHRLPLIILACCILHNILIDMEDEVQETLVFSDCKDLNYHPVFCNANDDQNGVLLREKIAVYLSGTSTS